MKLFLRLLGNTPITDDEGRIYFEFQTKLEGLPEIPSDDPLYDDPFFAFQVTDQAGNDYRHVMSYAQFMAPGSQQFGANRVADIQIAKYPDSLLEQQHVVFSLFPGVLPPKNEFNGKPAIRLEVEAHGTNFTQLTWISEVDKYHERKFPTLVFRNNENLAIVIDTDKYIDNNPPPDEDSTYWVQQVDKDGQAYVSNKEVIPILNKSSVLTPTIEPTLSPIPTLKAIPTATPNPIITFTPIPTPIATLSPTPTLTPKPTPELETVPEPTIKLATVPSNLQEIWVGSRV